MKQGTNKVLWWGNRGLTLHFDDQYKPEKVSGQGRWKVSENTWWNRLNSNGVLLIIHNDLANQIIYDNRAGEIGYRWLNPILLDPFLKSNKISQYSNNNLSFFRAYARKKWSLRAASTLIIYKGFRCRDSGVRQASFKILKSNPPAAENLIFLTTSCRKKTGSGS